MDWNLVIGAVIAIVASSLTALINHFLQIAQLNKKREWDLENEKDILQKEIVFERLSKIEEDIQIKVSLFTAFWLRLTTSERSTHDYFMTNADFDDINIFKNWHVMYLLPYFNDEKFTEYYEELDQLIVDITDLYEKCSKAIEEENKAHIDLYQSQLNTINIKDLYPKLIKRIDYIKKTYKNI